MTKRKIIQIAVTEGHTTDNGDTVNEGSFLVLCDDGTIWSRVEDRSRQVPPHYLPSGAYHWEQIPGVPQDETALCESDEE